MASYRPEHIQYVLVSALSVRNRVLGLLDLAHQINPVSLNAKITSAHVGSAGRVFSVMTDEITEVSSTLRSTVNTIRDITQKWTRVSATAAGQTRRLVSLQKAAAIAKAKGAVLPEINRAQQRASQQLEAFTLSYHRLLSELVETMGGLEKSLKIVNYVKIGILIESERLGSTLQDNKSPFQYLANEMQLAAEKIRHIANDTLQQLQRLHHQAAVAA